MESCPPLHLSVVAIEKGAFRSPLTKGDNFTFTFITNEDKIFWIFKKKLPNFLVWTLTLKFSLKILMWNTFQLLKLFCFIEILIL